MRYALISSLYDLDLVEEFNYHLLLAWAFGNETYRKFYKDLIARRPDDFFILDNGANEKKAIMNSDLVKLALDLNINEIQAPDFYQSSTMTITETKKFLKNDFPQLGDRKVQVMGIPQGKDYKSFRKCWDWMVDNPDITTIGLGYRNVLPSVAADLSEIVTHEWKDMGIFDASELLNFVEPETFKYAMSRIFFLKRKVNLIDLTLHKKRLHLLGLWQPVELKYYKSVFSPEELKIIRGCDSASPVQAAQMYVRFDGQLGLRNKPREYLDMFAPLGKKQREIAEMNIFELKGWLQ